MLKRKITFEDFNDPPGTHTDDFYFNISEAELLDLQVEYKGGLDAYLTKIVNEQDEKALVEYFKHLVLIAYGERSSDGMRFVKNDAIRSDFASHPAYSVFFMELATDAGKAAEFVNGIMPRRIAELMEQEELKNKMAEKLATIDAPAPELNSTPEAG